MNLKYAVFTLSLSALTLTGCGSSGSDDDTSTTPDGIYSGKVTGGIDALFSGDEKGIIYNNRLMVFSTVFDIQQLFDASITVSENTLEGTVSNYDNAFSPIRFTADINGTFVSNTSVSASFTNLSRSGFTDGTITLTANTSLYNKGSSLSTTAGSWQGTHGNTGDATTIAVDSDGSITAGSDVAGCNFTGSIIPADTNVNVYDVIIISTGGAGCTSLPAATYTGFAWTEGGTDTIMNLTVADGINSRSVILTKL